jgi:plastocyanin
MGKEGPGLRRLLRGAPAILVFACAVAAAQAPREVVIREYRFDPAEVKVPVGGTVRWTNDEKRTSHSVIFPAEGGLESERMFPGESWERRFDKPGRYDYRCGPHPEMKGSVVVGE